MKKHKKLPPRRDARIVSQYIPEDGSMVISVARGWTGAGEVLYRIESEKLAGAIEDRKELAVIVNNLGLLVLAQLCQFNLAESLDELPKALAAWAHIDIKALQKDDVEDALRIARQTLHGKHGVGTEADGPEEPDCPCRGTIEQTVCAGVGCGFCSAAEDMARKESNEGRGQDSLPSGGDEGVGTDGVSPGPDSPGAAPSADVAADEQRP